MQLSARIYLGCTCHLTCEHCDDEGRPPTSGPPSPAGWDGSAPLTPIAHEADPKTKFISDGAC